jgi:hypothetical protein
MVVSQVIAHIAAIAAALAFTPSIARAQQRLDILDMRVSSEWVPPGAITQVKVEVTEATPITTGDSHVLWSLGAIDGVALGSSDSAGVAVVRAGVVELSILSPTGSFGLSSDYPAFTLTGRVPATAPLGSRIPVRLDADTLQMFDANGEMYTAMDIDHGKVIVANRITVSDVVPGSADLPAGSIVSIFGTGFNRDTRIWLGDTTLAQVRYVSPTQMNVILAEPARMHGMRVRARNEDGFRVEYFSYQRTRRDAPSADWLLRNAVPVFPVRGMTAATVRVDETTVGLALQNIEATDAHVFLDLTDDEGRPIASAQIAVGVNRFVVLALDEIFDPPIAGAGVVRLTSVSAVQVIGVDVDAAGVARPRLRPRLPQ